MSKQNTEKRKKHNAIAKINRMITQYIEFMRVNGFERDSIEDKTTLALFQFQWMEYCVDNHYVSETYDLFLMNVKLMLEKAEAAKLESITE